MLLRSLLACCCASVLGAVTVTFDDLPPVNVGREFLPAGYGGISWSGDFAYYSWAQPPYNAKSDPSRVVTNRQGIGIGEVTFSFLNPDQIFQGAWFAGGQNPIGTNYVEFRLYNDGTLVRTSDSLIISSTPTFLPTNYNGPVDAVGVYGAKGSFAIDDFNYTSSVPEPTTGLLVLAGLVLATVTRRGERSDSRVQ